MTILAAREGENTYNKKTTAYYYYDVRVKTDHENFEKLRGSDILIDGLTAAVHSRLQKLVEMAA
jgi:hypothetical protein